MTIQETLRMIRKTHKLTQADVAARVGLPSSTYQSYELGTAEPSLSTMVKLADLYGVSVDYLLGHIAPADRMSSATETEQDIIETYLRIPEKNREPFRQVLTILVEEARRRTESKMEYMGTAGEILGEVEEEIKKDA